MNPTRQRPHSGRHHSEYHSEHYGEHHREHFHHPRRRGGPIGESHGPAERHGRRGGRGRMPRGDVRTAVLMLLAEQPMHGYQLMQTIGERTGGAWSPSPGAVYPTINQ